MGRHQAQRAREHAPIRVRNRLIGIAVVLLAVNGLAFAVWRGAGGEDSCGTGAEGCQVADGSLAPIMTIAPPRWTGTGSASPSAPATGHPAPPASTTASSKPDPKPPAPRPSTPEPEPVRYVNRYVSDLPFTWEVSGWGPVERDRSNGERGAGDGRTLSIRGLRFTKGLGVHGDSHVQVALGGRCTRFAATIGVDDEARTDARGGGTRVRFALAADGRLLYRSSVLWRYSRPVAVKADVSGVQRLTLVVDDLGYRHGDHADWAAARLTCRAS